MRSCWLPYFGPFHAPATDTGGGHDNIRDAFRAAVLEHQGGGGAGAGKESIGEDEDPDNDHDAGHDSDLDDDDDADPDERGRGDERTRGRQPAEAGTGKETAAGRTDEDADEGDDDSALSSDKAFQALQKQHANDPAALRKALLGDYTKKTQALASQRKQYERVRDFVPFLEAYEEDPATAIRVLAQQSGIDLSKLLGGAGEERPSGKGKAKTAEEASAELVEQVTADVREALGADLEYLADPIATAVRKAVDRLVPGHIERTVKPLEEQTRSLTERQLGEQLDATLKAFGEKYADWKDYEADMLELSKKVRPEPGSTEFEYMETLYKVASRDKWDADREAAIERAANGRFKKRLQKHDTAERGEETRSTPDSEVRTKAPKDVTFAAAYEAAKRGEVWEDDD